MSTAQELEPYNRTGPEGDDGSKNENRKGLLRGLGDRLRRKDTPLKEVIEGPPKTFKGGWLETAHAKLRVRNIGRDPSTSQIMERGIRRPVRGYEAPVDTLEQARTTVPEQYYEAALGLTDMALSKAAETAERADAALAAKSETLSERVAKAAGAIAEGDVNNTAERSLDSVRAMAEAARLTGHLVERMQEAATLDKGEVILPGDERIHPSDHSRQAIIRNGKEFWGATSKPAAGDTRVAPWNQLGDALAFVRRVNGVGLESDYLSLGDRIRGNLDGQLRQNLNKPTLAERYTDVTDVVELGQDFSLVVRGRSMPPRDDLGEGPYTNYDSFVISNKDADFRQRFETDASQPIENPNPSEDPFDDIWS